MISSDSLQQYAGRYPRIDDPLMRAAYLRGVTISESYYPPGTADWDQKARQVVLNEETADYLYTVHTPLDLHYVPGSRPQLERVVSRVVDPSMKERGKVLAIVDYCHHGFREDYADILPEKMVVLNAREEEVLKLNGGQCEDRARLMICLCQIAGIPARLVVVYSHYRSEENYAVHGGHAIVEIFCEDAWAFFDTNVMDFYCRRDDGRIASLWDLRQRPELVENQPDSVYQGGSTTKEKFVWYRDEYLSNRSSATISNYCAWDWWRYDWRWIPVSRAPGNADTERLRRERRALDRRLLAEIGITLADGE